MASIAGVTKHMLEGLRDLLETKDYSDISLKIVEDLAADNKKLKDDEDEVKDEPVTPQPAGKRKKKASTSSPDKEADQDEEAPDAKKSKTDDAEADDKSLDVHSLILHVNSEYFKKMLFQCKVPGVGRSEIVVRVKPAQRSTLKIIINSFYNQKLLDELGMNDLLAILELAGKFTNEEYLKRIDALLKDMKVNSFDQANAVLTRVFELEKGSDNLTLDKIKTTCTKYLGDLFCPLERRLEEHKNFMNMTFPSLIYLLQSEESIAISENSLLTFIILWLEHDTDRQTSAIVEGLMKKVMTKYLSVDFLITTITIKNELLSKWSGFMDWFVGALGYHGMSSNLKRLKYADVKAESRRDYAWYESSECNQAVCWFIKMRPEGAGKKFVTTLKFAPVDDKLMISDGYRYLIKCVTITPIPGESTKFNMSMTISCLSEVADARFLVGILPAHQDYDIKSKFFGSVFAQNFLKWSDALSFSAETGQLTLDLWQVTQDFIDVVNEHGLCVGLLPLSFDEYETSSRTEITCRKGHPLRWKAILEGSCSVCHQYLTNTQRRIQLSATSNWSV